MLIGPGAAEPRRILLVQLRNMGDVLLCTPAVRAARRAYPDAEIDFLAAAPGVDALTGNPYLDTLLTWRPGWREHWRLWRHLRRRRYDLVADFQSTPRTARLVWVTGAPRRLGVRGRGPRNRVYTDLVPKMKGPVYTAVQKLAVLSPLGVEPGSDLSLDTVIGPAERAWADEIWDRFGLGKGAPVIAISPVAREPFKQWGADRWAEVADEVAAAGARVLITSGPGEREHAAAVVARMQRPAVWDYGTGSLRGLAALYERCGLWLGNDGGPKHVAVAAGTPTLTVIRWQLGPCWTDLTSAVPHLFVDAAPPGGCNLRCEICAHRNCLQALPPAEVASAALEMLRSSAPRLVQLESRAGDG
jgi:heptosyltransferase III